MPDAKGDTPPDPAVYGSDEPWPRESKEYVGPQSKRGVRMVIVNLNAVRYRPKSGKLSYYKTMRLKINTKPLPEPDDPRMVVRYRPDPIRPLQQVDNPDTIKRYRER